MLLGFELFDTPASKYFDHQHSQQSAAVLAVPVGKKIKIKIEKKLSHVYTFKCLKILQH